MGVSQHFVQTLGGTVDVQLQIRPDAAPAPTVSVFGPGGTVYVDAQAATVDAVNTTLTAAPARGDRTVAVTSATGITVGREYLVGNGVLSPREPVRVRGVSTLTVTLSRPLMNAHVNASPFVGTRLSYPVTSAQATTLFFDGRVRWTWTDATVTRHTWRSVDCCEYAHERLATLQDLQRLVPKLFYQMPLELDHEELLSIAYEETLEQLEGPVRIRTRTDSQAFIDATCYAAAMRLVEMRGPEFFDQLEHYEKRWLKKCDAISQIGPFDNDQDGSVEAHEGGSFMIRVN